MMVPIRFGNFIPGYCNEPISEKKNFNHDRGMAFYPYTNGIFYTLSYP